MSPVFSVLLTVNNNCHDIATAMLAASGITMWVIIRRLEKMGSPEVLSLLVSLYGSLSKIVTFSLVWIAVGAIPRIMTFTSFEFADALADDHLPGLMARYIFSFAMALAGAFLWISLIKRIKEIRGQTL